METEGKVCIDLLERSVKNALSLIEKAVNNYHKDHVERFNGGVERGVLYSNCFEHGWTEIIVKKWAKKYFGTPFWWGK